MGKVGNGRETTKAILNMRSQRETEGNKENEENTPGTLKPDLGSPWPTANGFCGVAKIFRQVVERQQTQVSRRKGIRE